MANPYIGEIRMFAGNFAINGWAECNGQLLAIASYTALFSIIGTYYGGNGTSNFALPNFQGRVPIHQGTSSFGTTYVMGQQSGVENATLLYNNMPIHTHLINCNNAGGNNASPVNNYPAIESTGTSLNYATTGGSTMSPSVLGTAGGNVPFSIVQPYLTVTFLIALQGIFPARN
jgi:microcystin-dependent protein